MSRFLALLEAIVGWQSLYCHAVADGRLAGLFMIGSNLPRPLEPEGRVFVFPNSTGRHGQVSRVAARDAAASIGPASASLLA